ncbi:MAG: hypothetical protein ACYDIA_07635 [Candidatus Humimicrobiaceae bacterium]
MRESLFCRYQEDFSDKISEVFKKIDELELEIENIDIPPTTSASVTELSIGKVKNEIMLYFKYGNGSLSFDIALIKHILYELLIYIYIIKEKELSEEEKETCRYEIEKRFYFFLNCIYNFKEKLEKFFCLRSGKGKPSFKSNSILTENGKKDVLKLIEDSYIKIRNYCEARGDIVHDIYILRYDIQENKINESSSKFNLSEDNIIGQIRKVRKFILDDKKLAGLVEELQKIRKEVIEILLDTKRNIDLKKLIDKFKSGKGYLFQS